MLGNKTVKPCYNILLLSSIIIRSQIITKYGIKEFKKRRPRAMLRNGRKKFDRCITLVRSRCCSGRVPRTASVLQARNVSDYFLTTYATGVGESESQLYPISIVIGSICLSRETFEFYRLVFHRHSS